MTLSDLNWGVRQRLSLAWVTGSGTPRATSCSTPTAPGVDGITRYQFQVRHRPAVAGTAAFLQLGTPTLILGASYFEDPEAGGLGLRARVAGAEPFLHHPVGERDHAWALFRAGWYSLTEQLALTRGHRYSNEEKDDFFRFRLVFGVFRLESPRTVAPGGAAAGVGKLGRHSAEAGAGPPPR